MSSSISTVSMRASHGGCCRLARFLARGAQSVAADSSADKKPAKAAPKSKAERPFSNKQVFIVPAEVQPAFKAAWEQRERDMQAAEGFQGFSMEQSGDDFTVTSSWTAIPLWEAFNCSAAARRSHLPSGIWQRVPKPGEGFPEDFVPFLDMNTFVMAKY